MEALFDNRGPDRPNEEHLKQPKGMVLIHWSISGPWIYTIPAIEAVRFTNVRSRDEQVRTSRERYRAELRRELRDGDLKDSDIRGLVLQAVFVEIKAWRWAIYKEFLQDFQQVHREVKGTTIATAGLTNVPDTDSREVRISCFHDKVIRDLRGPYENGKGAQCEISSSARKSLVWTFAVGEEGGDRESGDRESGVQSLEVPRFGWKKQTDIAEMRTDVKFKDLVYAETRPVPYYPSLVGCGLEASTETQGN